ncbi:LysR family transcriptional regulator [Streptomyces sp. PT12]|uniref:LysR family transcriptional regulator n=1 Tax=Streptomyces sp. PT12 TaxID=1510197 RepID=UPI000DE20362|nr:LysR family transcriptional regulator [Streptomyces sp. PT12]RBM22983.1 LysR family transcriptional regulator [Streptomyces sp. PT12]
MYPELDPKLLITFRAVAIKGSLSAAARDLGWTQPALGQQMRRLERSLGTRLLDRSSRGVRLTRAGEVLLKHADAVVGRLSLAAYDVRAVLRERDEVVRLASFPSACAALVAPVIVDLSRSADGAEIRLTQKEPPEATRAVLRGEADAALVFHYDDVPEPDPDPGMDRISLGHDDLLALVAVGHPLTAAPAIRLEQLDAATWISGCPRCRAHLLTATAKRGFRPDIRHATDDYMVVQQLVASGVGVSLVPRLALRAYQHPGVAALPVDALPPRRLSLLVPHASQHPFVHRLADALRDVLVNAPAAAPTPAALRPVPASPADALPVRRPA